MQEQFKSHMSPYGFAIRLSDVDTHVSHGDFLCGIKQPTMYIGVLFQYTMDHKFSRSFDHAYWFTIQNSSFSFLIF